MTKAATKSADAADTKIVIVLGYDDQIGISGRKPSAPRLLVFRQGRSAHGPQGL
jgi:hypothetical protein